MNFEEFKKEVLARAKKEGACVGEYKRALESNSYEELAEVVKDNINWNRAHSIVTHELVKKCDKPEVWNASNENVGLFNSGDLNSGNQNSGNLNSGNRNSGNGNSGNLNSGDQNSGNGNSGDRNSGDQNSGELNSGYRNSGVFCTRKREDTIQLFNKDSKMTWNEWYSHPAYYASIDLDITVWISLNDMAYDEKKKNPQAVVCGGYLKKLSYHEAWANLWETLSKEQRDSFKTLPNFDSDIFYEITGIKI